MAGADRSPTLSSHLSCQVRVIRAENVEEIVSSKKAKGGSLFVRTYLSPGGAGNKTKARVQLNTRDLLLSSSSDSRFTWDESYSLDCRGALGLLEPGSVTFELRWRPATRYRCWDQSSSKLLGTAELPWGPAFSSPDSEIQAWVPLGVPSKAFAGSPAGLLVAMTVKAKAEVALAAVPSRRKSECRERSCGCGKDGSCQENYQLFVLAAALDAF